MEKRAAVPHNGRPAAVSASRAVYAIRYRRRTVTRRTSSGAAQTVSASLLRPPVISDPPVEQVLSVGRLPRRPRRQALFERVRRPSGSWLAARTFIYNSVRETDPEGGVRVSSAGVVDGAAHLTPNEPTRLPTARGATHAAGACGDRVCCGWPLARVRPSTTLTGITYPRHAQPGPQEAITMSPGARSAAGGRRRIPGGAGRPADGSVEGPFPLPPTGRAACPSLSHRFPSSAHSSPSFPRFTPSVAAERRFGLNPVHSRGFERTNTRPGETFRAYGGRPPP